MDNCTVVGLLCQTSSARQDTLGLFWCNSWSLKTAVCNVHGLRLWFIVGNIAYSASVRFRLRSLEQHFVLGQTARSLTDEVCLMCDHMNFSEWSGNQAYYYYHRHLLYAGYLYSYS